jgi:hypothetical protein
MSGLVMNTLFFSQKSGTSYTSNYGIESCQEDIIIMGASEVSHSFISNQIADSLGMTCYNLGMDGNNIYYQYAVLSELLSRYKPKIVITSTNVLEESDRTITSLFPYSYKYKNIREFIYEIKPVEKYKLFIKSYAYNSLIIKIIQGNILKEPKTNGYRPLFALSKNLQYSPIPYTIGISDRTLKYFEKYVNLCLNAGCKVFIVETPKYQNTYNKAENDKIMSLIRKYDVEHISFQNDTTFINHSELFKDRTHLNDQGARIFTTKIIDYLNLDNEK